MAKLHYLIKKLLNYNVTEHILSLGQMQYCHDWSFFYGFCSPFRQM